MNLLSVIMKQINGNLYTCQLPNQVISYSDRKITRRCHILMNLVDLEICILDLFILTKQLIIKNNITIRSDNCRKFSPANRHHHNWETIHQSYLLKVTSAAQFSPQHYYRVYPLLWEIHFLLGHAKWPPLPDCIQYGSPPGRKRFDEICNNRCYWSVRLDHEARISQYSLIY